ncbi:MAG: response regulator [Chitinophagaceae bacterium]|nr:MAG: response regulator [Chitinophagaceae bacterium]
MEGIAKCVTLRILVVEDSVDDYELLLRSIKKEGFKIYSQRVDTEEALINVLNEEWDVIISDFYLPGFDGMTSLELVREKDPLTPFILVSGHVCENIAIEAIKSGANDYLFKDNLLRLGPAITKGLDEKQLKINRLTSEKKIRANEKNLRLAHKLARSGYWEFNYETLKFSFSDELKELLNLEKKSIELRAFLKWIHPKDVTIVLSKIRNLNKLNTTIDVNFRLLPSIKRNLMFISARCTVGFEDNKPTEIQGIFQDVTEHTLSKQTAKKALERNKLLLTEMHHRVKNNLATITSLLELEKMSSNCKVTVDTLSRNTYHIYNMGILQELLYKSSDFSKIAFNQYLERLIELTGKSHFPNTTISITTSFDSIDIDISNAFPAAMIASEILSNSFQHSFVDQSDKRIHISLTESANEISLIVKDNGIGIGENFDYTKSNTPGFSLINIFIQQLSGTLKILNDNGTLAILTFKKSSKKSKSINDSLN